MKIIKKVMELSLIFVVLLNPVYGFCKDVGSDTQNLMEVIKSGKARLSSDKNNIIDKNGNIVATQILKPDDSGNKSKEKKDNNVSTSTGTVTSSTGTVTSSTTTTNAPICWTTCVKWGKQCYVDYQGHVACIKVCEEEKIVCK